MRKELALAALLIGVIPPSPRAAETRTNAPALQNRAAQESALRRENVTDDQRAKLKETNEKFRTEQNALYERLRNARRDLEQTAQADATDEKAIRAKAAVLGQVEGDLAILRAKHYKELRAILPHEQAIQQSGLGGTNHIPARPEAVRPAARTNAAAPAPAPVK